MCTEKQWQSKNMVKELQRLSNKQFTEDIKPFINSSHKFYSDNVPEIKTLAKTFHRVYSLREFYKVFNKLWNSGYEKEKSLAIYALQMYKEEFNLSTWKFLKPKLKEINDKEQIKSMREVLKEITRKNPGLEKEINKLNL